MRRRDQGYAQDAAEVIGKMTTAEVPGQLKSLPSRLMCSGLAVTCAFIAHSAEGNSAVAKDYQIIEKIFSARMRSEEKGNKFDADFFAWLGELDTAAYVRAGEDALLFAQWLARLSRTSGEG